MEHYSNEQGEVKLSDLPQKDYPLATVVDKRPITLEDVVEFLLEFKPILGTAVRLCLVVVWIVLLASLLLGKF